MALPKFKGTILLKSLVASCVLISSVGAESAAPTSQPNGAICGDTDPGFCVAELTSSAVPFFIKCMEDLFYEKCKGSCFFCPAPPPSPPPPSPPCGDTDPGFCAAELTSFAEWFTKCMEDLFYEKCKGSCFFCPAPPPSPPPLPPSSLPPPTNCAGLADETECTIKVERCQKKPPKSMRKCQKNCKKDGKKKPPLCEKTCCELGF